MAVRFDKDARKATNGPMIFFSDPSSQEAIREEIRGAILSGLSFYCYKHPGSHMISFGSSEGTVSGIEQPGFVIGMFYPDNHIITIPYRGIKTEVSPALYQMPDRSTTKEEYFSEIIGIQEAISDLPGSKIVAGRVEIENLEFEPSELFFNFIRDFPSSYVFCFGTPQTGCWIGASPELLLEGLGDKLQSMALAGTRRINENMAWDDKNIEEQEIVSRYLMSVFSEFGLSPSQEEPFSKRTGSIEHICTLITAKNPEGLDLGRLLQTLSPTPALCGYPKQLALDTIKRLEIFERGCYGGFCGPYHSPQDFTFNVVLRCASFSSTTLCKYAGGGITAKSTAEEEWLETQVKLRNTFTR